MDGMRSSFFYVDFFAGDVGKLNTFQLVVIVSNQG